MITSLDQLAEKVKNKKHKLKLAVTWAQDENTLGAVGKAVEENMVEAYLYGDSTLIEKISRKLGIDIDQFNIYHIDNETEAAKETVRLVKSGEADILMKGLIGTDKFLKSVLDKENGLMKPKAVLSYVCAIDVPDYHKLLFVTDTAVLPFPDLEQKVAMAEYAIAMAAKFGISKPKVALIGASEKMSKHFQNAIDYAIMCKMAERGQISSCIMDGPLDIFLACNKKSVEIKGVDTPVGGDADILLFPSLEACNPFYKGLMLFAKGELAGMLMGTKVPVVLMSRSESEKSKFFCIALSCLMADEKSHC
ncbi:MAG TPA: phosphate acetyltransferase [Bacteroidales bacterium]|nr:phosphate acetyltransferase [Bacteroidales bacterium]